MWVRKSDGEYVNLAAARKIVITDYSLSAVYSNGKDDKVEVLASGESVVPCREELLRCIDLGHVMVDLTTIIKLDQKKETGFVLNSSGAVMSGT